MKTLGIIPARGGSKSIPFKNIALLNGRPLISYTIEAALNSMIDEVVVSTDSEKIANISKKYGANTLKRKFKLSKDSTPTVEVLRDVYENMKDENFDNVICLQPTSPLRNNKHINEALELFISNQNDSGVLVSVIKTPHNFTPESLMKLKDNMLIRNFKSTKNNLRRQDKKVYYARNGPAILIFNKKSLYYDNLYDGKTIPYIMSSIDSIDIDEPEDLSIAEALLRKVS